MTIVVSLVFFSFWNKADYCRGWSAHYSYRGIQLVRERSATLAKGEYERARHLELAAAEMLVIAEKYAAVASNPFLAYPRYPLVTEAEREDYLSNHRHVPLLSDDAQPAG